LDGIDAAGSDSDVARIKLIWLKSVLLLLIAGTVTWVTRSWFGLTGAILGGMLLLVAIALVGQIAIERVARYAAVPYAALIGLFIAAVSGLLSIFLPPHIVAYVLVLVYLMPTLTAMGGILRGAEITGGHLRRHLESLLIAVGGVFVAGALMQQFSADFQDLPFLAVLDRSDPVEIGILSVVNLVFLFLVFVAAANLSADSALVRSLVLDRLPREREWVAAVIPLTTLFYMLGTILVIGGTRNSRDRDWMDRME